jgi:lipopolysaccharide transport system permease protein
MKRVISLKTNWYLLGILSVHDFRSQYLGSILGLFWTIIKPLALIGIYAVVFSSVITTIADQKGEPFNFGLFIFAGMLPWLAVQESLQRGTTIFVDFSHIVKHHAIPLKLLPFHIVLSATASELIAIVVFLLIKWLFNQNITPQCILILGLIPFQIAFCYGLTLMTATLNVFVRDISHLTTTLLFIWFFTTPIVFSLEHFPLLLQKILWLNPLTSLTKLYRDLLLVGRIPSVTTILIFLFFSVLFLVIGFYLHDKTRKAIADWV